MAQNNQLQSSKYLKITKEDIKFEKQIDQLRDQEYLMGSSSKKLRLLLILLFACIGLVGFNHFQGKKQGYAVQGHKMQEALGAMAGELNQEKKIWEFVDN